MLKRVFCSLKPALVNGGWDDATGVSNKLYRTIPEAVAAIKAADQDQIEEIVDFHYKFGKVIITMPVSKELIADAMAEKVIREAMLGILTDIFDGKIDPPSDPAISFKQYCENPDL